MLFNNILEEKKRTEQEYTAVHIRSDQRSRCVTILFCYTAIILLYPMADMVDYISGRIS